MLFQNNLKSLSVKQFDTAYLRRRVREEADAAVRADTLAATLIHVALSTAYAERCCYVADQAWVAQNRAW